RPRRRPSGPLLRRRKLPRRRRPRPLPRHSGTGADPRREGESMLHWFHFRSRAGTATALLALGGAVGVAAQTPPPAPSLEELLTEVCEAPPAAYGGFCDYLA